ncbi:hypothetical protein Mal52_16580 [Symmachiella dynata]|uniref:Uncharacterized protein n=1 Tax=Symmachiella dynata TaxID=2527995 RepID=A0A517ZL53_9PLAN|nr:hypothetical protein [Symmachiella dynata]QDU43186.1 hypothetical protein Mal52_16580 [Symmachiella dynata]
MMEKLCNSLIVSFLITAASADDRLGPAQETIDIKSGDLTVQFRDNSASPKILSGVQSLFNQRDAPGYDAYDPDGRGASAGLNFEHIISGHQTPHNKFTPRHGRYTLHRLPDQNSVQLVRRAEDSPWKVSSTLTYKVTAPHYIDFEFRCRVHDAQLFGERGWALFFFANYMNDVAEVPLHFRGIKQPGDEETWIAGDAPAGPADWNGGGTYRHVDAAPLEYDDDVKFRLNSWSYDAPRFTKPFYYGRVARDMTLILMFDKAHTPVDEMRLSLFKFKLPQHPRPAWDFQYVVHRVEENREYGFRGRLVWKKFVSPADCLEEYQTWAKNLPADPANGKPSS